MVQWTKGTQTEIEKHKKVAQADIGRISSFNLLSFNYDWIDDYLKIKALEKDLSDFSLKEKL
jgi:hypothetical protein